MWNDILYRFLRENIEASNIIILNIRMKKTLAYIHVMRFLFGTKAHWIETNLTMKTIDVMYSWTQLLCQKSGQTIALVDILANNFIWHHLFALRVIIH